MLLAPFTLSEIRGLRPASIQSETPSLPVWLQLWAIGGILGSAMFPLFRAGEMTGWSLPFWLIAAPLINILWLKRSHGWIAIRNLGVWIFEPKKPLSRRTR